MYKQLPDAMVTPDTKVDIEIKKGGKKTTLQIRVGELGVMASFTYPSWSKLGKGEKLEPRNHRPIDTAGK
jgi:hypothetical protein